MTTGTTQNGNSFTVASGNTGNGAVVYAYLNFDVSIAGKKVITISKIKCSQNAYNCITGFASQTTGYTVSKFYKNGYMYVIGSCDSLPSDGLLRFYYQLLNSTPFTQDETVSYESTFAGSNLPNNNKLQLLLGKISKTYEFELNRNEMTLIQALSNGAVSAYKGFKVPTGAAGNTTYLTMGYFPLPQHFGKQYIFKYYCRTNIPAAQFANYRWNDSIKLMEYCLENYTKPFSIEQDKYYRIKRVNNGNRPYVRVGLDSSISLYLSDEEYSSLVIREEFPDTIDAEVHKGQQIGKLVLYSENREIYSIPFKALEDVRK
jgi:hypothetical protein